MCGSCVIPQPRPPISIEGKRSRNRNSGSHYKHDKRDQKSIQYCRTGNFRDFLQYCSTVHQYFELDMAEHLKI